MNLSPVIVALDLPDRARAVALAERLDCKLCRIKIGLELFTAEGPRVVEMVQKLGFEVFLDLKLHDIPNTVAAACRQAAALGVWMIDVHAGGGGAMMRAAVDALGGGSRRPLLVAVTLLTSIGAQEFAELGYANALDAQVSALARLSRNCGLDGVVCSPLEVAALRRELGTEAVLVTPGVRPAGSATDDQQRTATPKAALAAGASYLVIGRPVTQAPSPNAALAAILDSID